jgi:hypothetical protein
MIVPTPAPVKIRFKVNPTPGSHGAGMGSASKGKRVASGPIGGKAKHARIGMSTVPLLRPSSSEHRRYSIKSAKGEIEKELMTESPPTSDLKDEEEELGDDETRSTSPSKLTARQRAKGNKDLQETLVSLPGTFSLSLLSWFCSWSTDLVL